MNDGIRRATQAIVTCFSGSWRRTLFDSLTHAVRAGFLVDGPVRCSLSLVSGLDHLWWCGLSKSSTDHCCFGLCRGTVAFVFSSLFLSPAPFLLFIFLPFHLPTVFFFLSPWLPSLLPPFSNCSILSYSFSLASFSNCSILSFSFSLAPFSFPIVLFLSFSFFLASSSCFNYFIFLLFSYLASSISFSICLSISTSISFAISLSLSLIIVLSFSFSCSLSPPSS